MRAPLSLALSLLLVGCSSANVRAGTADHHTVSFTKLWTASVAPLVDSAPILVPNVSTGSGKQSVLYVLAGNNGSNCSPGDPVHAAMLYALTATHGKHLWHASTSGPARCTTAGPAAGPGGTWIYAIGLDGRVHRYAATTGKESTGHGWPERVTDMPDVEKVSAAFAVSRGYLYVTTSGYIGDQGHYEGHLVTINLKSGKRTVFNSLCSNIRTLLGPTSGKPNYCASIQSGLFGRGQGVTDPLNRDVYIVSGNGPWNGDTDWGDSIMKLHPDGTKLVDSYTPTNQASLNRSDQDLGSTGPAILPPVALGGKTYHLLVQGGKGPACDGCGGVALRLIDRDDMSGQGGPGHLGGDLADAIAPGGCETLTAPAVATSSSHVTTVIYANDCGTAGYRVEGGSSGKPTLQRVWSIGTHGTTPVVHAGVLYVARDNTITAYNPATGKVLGSTGGIGAVHWQNPLIVGKTLYIADQDGHITAFAIHT
jgi:outer membrane protein assembly factor BamB